VAKDGECAKRMCSDPAATHSQHAHHGTGGGGKSLKSGSAINPKSSPRGNRAGDGGDAKSLILQSRAAGDADSPGANAFVGVRSAVSSAAIAAQVGRGWWAGGLLQFHRVLKVAWR
jgi:hypothetical protein